MQDLVEKVMILWKGVDSMTDGLHSGHLANRLYDYASLLASQGYLATALNYLAPVTSDDVCFAFSPLISTLLISKKVLYYLRQMSGVFIRCASVCSRPVNQTSLKRLKLQVSNLMCMFPGTVQT